MFDQHELLFYPQIHAKFHKVIDDELNDLFVLSANKDQTGRAFMQDLVMSLFDEGCVAVTPVNTSIDPTFTDSYNVMSLRVGKIVQWFPNYVVVNLYNEAKGMREDVRVEKRYTSIIENPFYSIMNETNSTLKRLLRKMRLMDDMDNQIASGKLDLIIQLPYVLKGAAKKELVETRRAEIERQLKGPYGIAYTDGTERIVQLNRPIENNFDKQVETLSNQLYSELGLTVEVFNGTATEPIMLNYYRRTIKPVLAAIVDEYNRKFISKTARSQKQRIMYIRDPFEIVGTSQLAEIADKFTRNEILSSNEVRAIVGMYPSDDPKADELRNKNLSPAKTVTEEIQVEHDPSTASESYKEEGW